MQDVKPKYLKRKWDIRLYHRRKDSDWESNQLDQLCIKILQLQLKFLFSCKTHQNHWTVFMNSKLSWPEILRSFPPRARLSCFTSLFTFVNQPHASVVVFVTFLRMISASCFVTWCSCILFPAGCIREEGRQRCEGTKGNSTCSLPVNETVPHSPPLSDLFVSSCFREAWVTAETKERCLFCFFFSPNVTEKQRGDTEKAPADAKFY